MRKPAAAKKTTTAAAAKPAVKAVAKPAAKPVAKPAVKAAAKTGPKVDVKAVKPAPKKSAALKPAPAKAPKKPAASAAPVDGADPMREKARKAKLVRDSFTMPEHEYEQLGQVKRACLKAGFEVKKSELLRIGVALISQMDLATLQNVLASLPQLKTGRPKNA
jgi:hypothetical protein